MWEWFSVGLYVLDYCLVCFVSLCVETSWRQTVLLQLDRSVCCRNVFVFQVVQWCIRCVGVVVFVLVFVLVYVDVFVSVSVICCIECVCYDLCCSLLRYLTCRFHCVLFTACCQLCSLEATNSLRLWTIAIRTLLRLRYYLICYYFTCFLYCLLSCITTTMLYLMSCHWIIS